MKKKIVSSFVFICTVALLITSCKKDNSSNNNTQPSSDQELAAQADDQSNISAGMDNINNDANTTLSTASSNISGRLDGLICDASVTVDSVSNPRTITIVYNGSNCQGNRTRTGTVKISIPSGTHWRDAGARVILTYTNVKVTRVLDNKSVTFNGADTLTNVSGGRLDDLATQSSITHTITGFFSVTFDNGAQKTWNIDEKRVFTYDGGVVVTVSGLHTDGSLSNIVTWGTNRFGNPFKSVISTSLVLRQDCNFRIGAGVISHIVPAGSAVATFGLDINGNATSCPGTGYYFLKLSWTGSGGTTITKILPY